MRVGSGSVAAMDGDCDGGALAAGLSVVSLAGKLLPMVASASNIEASDTGAADAIDSAVVPGTILAAAAVDMVAT